MQCYCELSDIMYLRRPRVNGYRRGVLYISWRVTEGEDTRHKDGRLYSAFDSEFIASQFDRTGILFFEDKISVSSSKRVCRLVWKNK